ncbi:alpha/beta fold hydrolase [Actinoplanes utahensis]|uniref:Alpha/beta hydrolase n=1 Tax=Actinoplanes utahensis TaxID=1869 RepID=A0A0A6UR49_ACTUT|nr:alpha/beta fold hydrolase [Actinoplanes utahensis]KHD77896.1 alpha/beta hydrolase [Actinoplanes utahensis]GIF32401.1 hydrolase [Actinoplanes utahensis]
MPMLTAADAVIPYEDRGAGEPIVLIMGSAASGRAWHLHQVPALVAAGHRVVTFDNRGMRAGDTGTPFTIDDLVADTVALIEQLDLGPCRVVGTSMGSYVAAELALARPELLRQVVLMAARARSDEMRIALSKGERLLADSGLELPPEYRAAVRALQTLSPRTLDDERAVRDWLDLFELSPETGPGVRAQARLEPMPDRRAAYAGITVPCHVLSFADDLITPPSHGRELAAAIPGATYEVIAEAGHYGYLEQPDLVNQSLLRTFTTS